MDGQRGWKQKQKSTKRTSQTQPDAGKQQNRLDDPYLLYDDMAIVMAAMFAAMFAAVFALICTAKYRHVTYRHSLTYLP